MEVEVGRNADGDTYTTIRRVPQQLYYEAFEQSLFDIVIKIFTAFIVAFTLALLLLMIIHVVFMIRTTILHNNVLMSISPLYTILKNRTIV